MQIYEGLGRATSSAVTHGVGKLFERPARLLTNLCEGHSLSVILESGTDCGS
jgi:hypothetical protein